MNSVNKSYKTDTKSNRQFNVLVFFSLSLNFKMIKCFKKYFIRAVLLLLLMIVEIKFQVARVDILGETKRRQKIKTKH